MSRCSTGLPVVTADVEATLLTQDPVEADTEAGRIATILHAKSSVKCSKTNNKTIRRCHHINMIPGK
eukprot:6472789-Amphidinium_carterae.2